MSEFAQNVGPWDALARFVLGVALVAGAFWLTTRYSIDWALSLIIHPTILGVYLLLSAAARNDIAYHVFGWSTMPTPRGHSHMRLAPPSVGRRTS